MKIVFFGSADFSVPSLKALQTAGHEIPCVVTQPDKKKGRGLHLGHTAVKDAAGEMGIEVYQPQDINSKEAIDKLRLVTPDLFVVIAYGNILSKELLGIPKIFSVNAHASLLPAYRGAAPINWALMNGEPGTGVTIIKMNSKMDAGPILTQEETKILDTDDHLVLEERLAVLAAELTCAVIDRIEKNEFELIPQDEMGVSFAPKLKKEHGLIDWNADASGIHNKVRGLKHSPGAFTMYNGRILKIYSTSVSDASFSPEQHKAGSVLEISKEGIIVATGGGSLRVEELQPEGKRKMSVREFISGHRMRVGEILG